MQQRPPPPPPQPKPQPKPPPKLAPRPPVPKAPLPKPAMQKLVEQRTNDVQVAKDRAIMSKRPELTANYYDGWFPLNRPIKHGSVPILIGFAALLFTFSIMLLLELLGIKTLFTVYVPLGIFSRPGYPNQTNKPLWLMSFIAVLFFAVSIYLYFSR
jgi:hypothetical protein